MWLNVSIKSNLIFYHLIEYILLIAFHLQQQKKIEIAKPTGYFEKKASSIYITWARHYLEY